MPSTLQEVEPSACVALRRNPQYLTPHQMDALKTSISRDGFLAPVLLRPLGTDRYEVLSGNHRVMCARELGLAKIPALIADLDDSAAQRVAVNLNTVHGNPTVELLAPFLAEMDDAVLSTVHLDDELLHDLRAFDESLASSLASMQKAPDSFNAESPKSTLDRCRCPTCGREHFRRE